VGCSAGSGDAGGADGGPSLAEQVRARAARDSQELAERYDAVIAAHPALAQRLGPLRAEVAAHREAFGGAGKASPGATEGTGATAGPTGPEGSGAPAGAKASPAVSASPSPSSAAASPSPAAPERPEDALARLASAERSLSDRRTRELLQVPGELARLLASVAAAGAAHAYLLTEGDR
jgi:hypothetical protein